jgi:tetratricopeptide (TPR) repeat protein
MAKSPEIPKVQNNSFRILIFMLLLSICLFFLAQKYRIEDSTTPLNSQAAVNQTVESGLSARLDKETATLIGKPRNFKLINEQARDVRALILHGDFDNATTAINAILQNSKMQFWRFYPFRTFMEDLVVVNQSQFESALNQWVNRDKNSALPHLIRAKYNRETAWKIRGEKVISKTKEKDFLTFKEKLNQAETDITAAIKFDENNPYSWLLWIDILYGHGSTPEMEQVFKQAIKKYPNYYSLYVKRLASLAPKWGGSIGEMYKFVDTYAGKASNNSPFKLLYLELYRGIIDSAYMTCDDSNTELQKECVNETISKLTTEELVKSVQEALSLHKVTDKYQFSLAIEPILDEIIWKPGAETASGSILQLIADNLGSNSELSAADTSKNNFVIDKLTGSVWRRFNHNENAEKLLMRSLSDIDHTDFPNEEEKSIAKAALYDILRYNSNEVQNYEKVIVYQKTAEALGGAPRGDGHMKCFAYFRLKLYDKAVQDCSEQINIDQNVENFYWRAMAYKALNQTDEAINDLLIVANSEHEFNDDSVIDISVIYAHRKDYQSLLKILNDYPFLFDEEHQDKNILSISYNNRCFAKMKLGHLQEALDDCTSSLKFGNLPDAFKKQQELVKLLQHKKT